MNELKHCPFCGGEIEERGGQCNYGKKNYDVGRRTSMRPIDADAFLKDILTAGIGKTIIEYSESDIGYMIRKRPTIDAVPVVRCRECTEFDEAEHECSHWYGFRENDFCSYGKRKEGADNEP